MVFGGVWMFKQVLQNEMVEQDLDAKEEVRKIEDIIENYVGGRYKNHKR